MTLIRNMARNTPYTIYGLAVLFVVLIIALPVAKTFLSPYSSASGFSNMACKNYEKPCDEGYFCQEQKCTPIFPRL